MARRGNKKTRKREAGRGTTTRPATLPRRRVPRLVLNREKLRWEVTRPRKRVSTKHGIVDPLTGEIYSYTPAPAVWRIAKAPPPPPPKTPFLQKLSLYKLPARAGVCVRRKIRRQVLMAISGGQGVRTGKTKYRRNEDSKVSC